MKKTIFKNIKRQLILLSIICALVGTKVYGSDDDYTSNINLNGLQNAINNSKNPAEYLGALTIALEDKQNDHGIEQIKAIIKGYDDINIPFEDSGLMYMMEIEPIVLQKDSLNQVQAGYTNMLLYISKQPETNHAMKNFFRIFKEQEMKEKLNFNIKDEKGKTPLWNAVDRGDFKFVEFILSQPGINPNISVKEKNDEKDFPLLKTLKRSRTTKKTLEKNIKNLKNLVEYPETNINVVDSQGYNRQIAKVTLK